jgi:hypothetical protein
VGGDAGAIGVEGGEYGGEGVVADEVGVRDMIDPCGGAAVPTAAEVIEGDEG